MRVAPVILFCAACARPTPEAAPAPAKITLVAGPAPLTSAPPAPPPAAPGLRFSIPPSEIPAVFAGSAGNVPGADASITSITGSGEHVFAAGTGFVFRSTDRGHTFEGLALPARFPRLWAASPRVVYVGGENRVLRSDDGAVTFEPCALAPGYVVGFTGNAEQLFAAVSGSRPAVLRSTDACRSWTELTAPIGDGWLRGITSSNGSDLIVFGHEQRAGKRLAVVARSTNAGKSWSRLPFLANQDGEQSGGVCMSSGRLIAASAYSVYSSTDLGKTWTLAAEVGAEVLTLACGKRFVFVGGRNRKVLVSHDSGRSFTDDPWLRERIFADQPALVSAQASWSTEDGEAYLGFESAGKGGTVLRWEPPAR